MYIIKKAINKKNWKENIQNKQRINYTNRVSRSKIKHKNAPVKRALA